ncbi:MAG TPA: ATP-binding protein [Bryobacteraceae bacterium]|nr:ATP-binding protein [Bryobacteraceae bacterium]
MNLLTVAIRTEQDVVLARRRARQIAELAAFDQQDQIRIATAVSELARNAFQYAGGGRATFSVHPQPARLEVLVSDTGPGIANLPDVLSNFYRSTTGLGLGICGARRLMDGFEVNSSPGGTQIRISKRLPHGGNVSAPELASTVAAKLAAAEPAGALDEMQQQNAVLIRAMEELRQRETELRQLNQELEETNRGVMALYAELDDKAQSLRRADEIKSRFLSHMSHEFRTPLNSILALTRLLQSRVDGDLAPEQERQIGYIQQAAEELVDMVNDLLDLAKVESGTTTLQITEFTVANTFGALRGMLRPLQMSESLTLVIEEPNSELMLRTDEGKVSQVIRNLVSNALKFTERGEVRVSVNAADEGVTFSVKDTGIGIAPAEQERIFQEFAQVEGPIQRRVRGTGLGLPLSRKLAELLGGALTVESEPGVGSTFRFTLPPGVIVGTDAPAAGETDDGSRVPETLLVIDDDKLSHYLVGQLFRNSSATILSADNGAIGLERARFEKPSLIILDLNMPGLSGFQVLEELAGQPETASIPVVVLTSLSLSDADRQRLTRHAAAIVSKQELGRIDLADLVQQITGLSLTL